MLLLYAENACVKMEYLWKDSVVLNCLGGNIYVGQGMGEREPLAELDFFLNTLFIP